MKIRQLTTCQTCRTRKLACDGVTPTCSQCLLSGRTCPGYQHDLIFRPPIIAGQQPVVARASKRKRAAPLTNLQIERVPYHRQTGVEHRSTDTTNTELHPYRQPSTVPSPLSWPLLDIVSLVVQNFSPPEVLDGSYLVTGGSGISTPRVCGAWVQALPELARGGRAETFLSPSIKTLAVSMLSRAPDGRAPVSDALAAHAFALASLRSGLQGKVGSSSNMFAAAVMCLFLSETILPTSRSSATVHAKGIGDLLQLQDPEFYSSGVSHQLFVGFRPVLFLHSLRSRQKVFLAEDRWLTAPFSISSAAPLQNLFSEVITLPSTLEEFDALKSVPVEQAEAVAFAVFEKLKRSLYDLVGMGEALRSEGQDLYQFPTYPTENHTHNILFPSLTAANLLTHIWAFHIVCARHIAQLTCSFPSIHEQVEPSLERLISRETVIQLSSLILRSMEFLTLDKFKLSGAASTTLPLHVVCDVLKDQGRDSKELWYWYHRVLQMYSSRGYYYMIEYVLQDEI